MSRRQFTTLKLSVSLPLPAGMTQRKALDLFKTHLEMLSTPAAGYFPIHQAIIKLVGKDTTYL